MSNDNKISIVITPEQKAAFLAAIAEARENAPENNLTATERQRIPTIGVERAALVQAFNTLIASHPDLVPNLVDLPEYHKDNAAWNELLVFYAQAEALCETIRDTLHLIGSDMLMAYGSIYQNVKQAAKRSVPGADSALALVAPYFRRGGGGGATPPGNGTNS